MNLIRYFLLLSVLVAFSFQISAQDTDIVDAQAGDGEISAPDNDIEEHITEERPEPAKTGEDVKIEPEATPSNPEPETNAPVKKNYSRKKNERKIFAEFAKNESFRQKNAYVGKKAGAVILMTAGLGVAFSGLGLAISDADIPSGNKVLAREVMMYFGVLAVGGGVILNFSSEHSLQKSHEFSLWYDANILSDEDQKLDDDELVKLKNSAKRKSAQKLFHHGIGMTSLAVPLFAVSIYTFVKLYREIEDDYSHDDDYDKHEKRVTSAFRYMTNAMTLLPGIAVTVAGAMMIRKSNEWKSITNVSEGFSLDYIAPMIDPVSKSYALNLGFSF